MSSHPSNPASVAIENTSTLANRLAPIFNEYVMGFLALVAVATALGPLVFDVSAESERLLMLVEWVLVGMFAAEFLIQGALAPDRRAWIRNPWRIVDLVTVLGPVAALLPQVSNLARGSLMFRILRLGRAVAFGTRAGSAAVRPHDPTVVGNYAGTPTVTVVSADGDVDPAGSDWSTFLAWTRAPAPLWFHVSKVGGNRFEELARAVGMSEEDIDRLVVEEAQAKIREGHKYTTLALQMPTVAESGFPSVQRARILAVVTNDGMLTATTAEFDLHGELERLARKAALPPFPFPARFACALLALARGRNAKMAHRFDEEVRQFEVVEGGRFLADTSRLRSEISTAALDIWHLKAVVRALADGKTTLRGIDLKEAKYLDDLLAETESLYETVNKTKEELKGLIELHINQKSFETNVFLKLLAVVSFLGLIPSVVGGLLGMNVVGNPWPVTLGQVAFSIAMAMAVSLYVFAVKGWLR
jgi:Mg2+ and Co2+ transporter CorA